MMSHFNQSEVKALLCIGSTIFFRLFGLFALLPIFALMAGSFSGSSGVKIGLALGVYGLTQGLLQIPLGYLSDRFGRKKIALMGLLLFLMGSIYGVFASHIDDLIVARFLQGMGAIASVLSAWLSDMLKPTHHRIGFMLLGLSIGLAFIISIFLTPLLSQWFNLNHFFLVMVLFSFISMCLLISLPAPEDNSLEFINKKRMAINKPLLLMICGLGFLTHALLPAFFMWVPSYLLNVGLIALKHQGWIYILIMLLSLPVLAWVMKKTSKQYSIILALVSILFSGLFFSFHAGYLGLFLLAMALFFLGFNIIEATLPSWVAEITTISNRGVAMGFLMTSEFFGTFMGSLIGGYFFTM